ncbi:CHAP domain-containing protein [Microtetraspora niveoalba]|uniref:CHAP domain-containing protein n=1 Tax=Microtetraspora niveoalba TaxID=46175 RepID=UPI00082B4F12|nr:CHAP domain-containing protein [Microtetraspora niveoalba]
MATSNDVLRIARAQLGTGERSDGTSIYGSWYARLVKNQAFAAAPWCQAFVSWVAREAGIPTSVIPNGAWTVAVADWFAKQGQFSQTPHPGDIVWFDWQGSKNVPAIDHVGFVESILSDGRIVTIEGNTANAVRRRVRSRSCIAGFGHWARTTATPKPAPKPVLTPTEVFVKQLPTLKPGTKGWHVKTVVHLLAARDYAVGPGVDDTVLSPAVVERLRAFKKAAGLPEGDTVDLDTWAKLLRL